MQRTHTDSFALTVTLEALPRQPPQQGPTMLTEGWALVVVDFEPVWHVDLESLLVELKGRQKDWLHRHAHVSDF